jgi:hypothetical protein
MNKQNDTEAYKLPFTQLLLCNSDDMLTHSNRVDLVSPVVADHQIAEQPNEVQVLFEKHSKFSKKMEKSR